MGVLRDTILVSVATLGVGSAFMEIESKNTTFNKVFPYIGTFLSAGIGYYFLRQSKLIKASEFQPDQELSDYSLDDLATSSAIEGFEPFKYSVVGNLAEGLETKIEEYDAESVLKEKPSMNFVWKNLDDWEIDTTMEKIYLMTKNEIIVPYPLGVSKYSSLKDQKISATNKHLIIPMKQSFSEYSNLLSLSGYMKYDDATFYLLQTNMKVLKAKRKKGDSEYKDENSYLVYCEHDGKMNLVCGASYPIDENKVYASLKQELETEGIKVFSIRQGFVTGRKEATQYAEDYLYFHLLKPVLKYSFNESFQIEFGERKQEDYQNMIIPLKYKRKIKGKAISFTNYYYTNHHGELDFLFAIGEFDRPLNQQLTFYCDMGWQFGSWSTFDRNYPFPKQSWIQNYGIERLAKIFAERPIIQMWVKSITLDSDNLKTRRINMFNEDKQAWFDQQFKPMLIENFYPLITTEGNYPSKNVYEEFMKMTHKRLGAKGEMPSEKDALPLEYFKKYISYYDWLNSVKGLDSSDNPRFYQNINPSSSYSSRYVTNINPYKGIGLKYTIQGKMNSNFDKSFLKTQNVPQPPAEWYKKMRIESGAQRSDFGKIVSSVLTIGVCFNNTVYEEPISIIPFEINDTKNEYVKAFRLLYSRALRENEIAEPQTVFDDRLKWSLYSIDEDAFIELDRTSDEAKKVVEDYYKQLDNMVLAELRGYGFKHHSVRKAENFESESTSKIHSVEISRSSNPEKKLMAIFSDKEGNKVKTTHFGQRGASDYTKHGDKERMLRYLERHGGGTNTSTKEDWKDPTTAGSLSRWILWNKPSLSGSFADYKRRFGLKGSLNVSKSSEGLETKNTENFDEEIALIENKYTKEQLRDLLKANFRTRTYSDKIWGKRKYEYGIDDKLLEQTPLRKLSMAYSYDIGKRNQWLKGKKKYDRTDGLAEWRWVQKRKQGRVISKPTMRFGAETFEEKSYGEMFANFLFGTRNNRSFFEKYIDKLDWNSLSFNPALTPALIEKYDDKWNWIFLSQNPSLTPALIEKYAYYLNWNELSENPALTPALIERYEADLHWIRLSRNPSLTPALIEKYKDKLNWYELSKNPNLTPELIEKYKDKLNWGYLSANPSLTPALIEKYDDTWLDSLALNPSLTPALIEKYKDKLNWERLSKNPSLTPALIEKYKDKWTWDWLSRNPALTPALIEKYIDKVNWSWLSRNPSLTTDLIEKYKDKLKWGYLSANPLIFKKDYAFDKELQQMFFEANAETFEATEWVGFCPECNKWRTKDMSLLFKNPSKNRSDEDYIIDLSFNGWSVPKKLLNKRVCGKSKQYGDIQRTTDSWSGYYQRTYSNSVCGTPLTKVKSKYKAESYGEMFFEAKSPAQKSLDKWTKEDWGTKSGNPSTQGSQATGERYLPAKAREALTDEEYARTTDKKRRDTEAGMQFSPQPDDIEEKVKKYRSDIYNDSKNAESFEAEDAEKYVAWQTPIPSTFGYRLSKHHITQDDKLTLCGREIGYDSYTSSQKPNNLCKGCERIDMRVETFEAIEGKGSNARFTDQPDPKVYRDPALRQKARNKLLKGNKGGEEGEWSARKAQMSATEYRKLYENKYGEGKNPYF